MISSIVQPPPEANATIDTTSTIISKLLTIMQQMQQLTVQMQANQEGVGLQTNNLNTHNPPTHQAAT